MFYFTRNDPTVPGYSLHRHYTWHEHNVDLLVAEMDAAGVDQTYLISYDDEDVRWSEEHKGYGQGDFAGGRNYTLRGARRYPDRFHWFNTLKRADRYDVPSHIDRDIADGAVGFKLFPAYVGAKLDSDDWKRIFHHIANKGSRILISFETLNPPETPSLPEYVDQLDRCLTDGAAPPLTLMHAGCADPLQPIGGVIVDFCRRHPGVYLSMAMPGEVWDDGVEYPFPRLLSRAKTLLSTIGSDRLMWATDWPWFTDRFLYRQNVDAFMKHADFMTQRDLDLYMGENALRFLQERAR